MERFYKRKRNSECPQPRKNGMVGLTPRYFSLLLLLFFCLLSTQSGHEEQYVLAIIADI